MTILKKFNSFSKNITTNYQYYVAKLFNDLLFEHQTMREFMKHNNIFPLYALVGSIAISEIEKEKNVTSKSHFYFLKKIYTENNIAHTIFTKDTFCNTVHKNCNSS